MSWRLFGMLRPYRGPLVWGFLCLMIATPAQLFHPLVWMFVVDEVIAKQRVAMLVPAMLFMFLVHMAGAALNSLRTWLLGRAGQRFTADLRARLHAKLLRQPLASHHERRSGETVSRVIGDADVLQEVVVNGVDSVLANILGLLWVAGLVLWLQWKVGLITLIPLVFVAFITWGFNARVKALYRRIRDRLGALSAHVQEHLSGIAVIKGFAREDFEGEHFARHNEDYLVESFKGVTARSLYFPGVMALGFVTNVSMIGLGAYFVLRGEFTLGGLIAYRGYWWHLFQPVFALAQTNEMLQRARASAGRVFEILDAPEEEEPVAETAPVTLEGHVRFDRVCFGYRPETPILDEVSFEAAPGQRVAIVGPSGAGKSTIFSLLLRFHLPQSGAIMLDNRDLRTMRLASFRRQMALVGQEPFLFNESVADNIRFGRIDATLDDIEAAARAANAHEFIERLPEGYETLVGERGVKLSGGQKQRLCIARAFLANPAILLLDEATAAVEPESEAQILAALERLEAGRTTIMVSHRLPLVRDCSRIFVLTHHRIAEAGTHAELMALGGWYARMYALQVEGVSVSEP